VAVFMIQLRETEFVP